MRDSYDSWCSCASSDPHLAVMTICLLCVNVTEYKHKHHRRGGRAGSGKSRSRARLEESDELHQDGEHEESPTRELARVMTKEVSGGLNTSETLAAHAEIYDQSDLDCVVHLTHSKTGSTRAPCGGVAGTGVHLQQDESVQTVRSTLMTSLRQPRCRKMKWSTTSA